MGSIASFSRGACFTRTAARLVLASCLTAAMPAAAFNPKPDPPGFGMIGIVRDQMARLSVADIGGASPPEPDAPVELLFLDGSGATLARSVVTVSGGAAASLDLRGDSLGIIGPNDRMQVRAVVRALGNRKPAVVPTLELFDTVTGRTTVSYPWAATDGKPLRFGSPRRPDPPGYGAVGLVRGQTARLNVVGIGNPDEEPAPVELLFLDAGGAIVGRRIVDTSAGRSAHLDLRWSDIGNPNERQQVRALVRLVESATPRLAVTLEVFDDATGRTVVVYPWTATSPKPLRFGTSVGGEEGGE